MLVVNAGIVKFASIGQTTEALYGETMDINFKGAFFTVQKALPLLKDGGAIVINTSVVAGKSMPNGSVYVALRTLVARGRVARNGATRGAEYSLVSSGEIRPFKRASSVRAA